MADVVRIAEESPGSTEQGARRKPGKRFTALTVPRKRACGQPRESNRNGTDRHGAPDETGNPPCCNLRSGRTQPIPVADGGSPRPKVESSREGDDAARPNNWDGERWSSAQ